MSPPRAGTARGDKALYAGRELLGHIRGSISTVYAYGPSGEPIGTFGDMKAAKAALMERAAGKAVAT